MQETALKQRRTAAVIKESMMRARHCFIPTKRACYNVSQAEQIKDLRAAHKHSRRITSFVENNLHELRYLATGRGLSGYVVLC